MTRTTRNTTTTFGAWAHFNKDGDPSKRKIGATSDGRGPNARADIEVWAKSEERTYEGFTWREIVGFEYTVKLRLFGSYEIAETREGSGNYLDSTKAAAKRVAKGMLAKRAAEMAPGETSPEAIRAVCDFLAKVVEDFGGEPDGIRECKAEPIRADGSLLSLTVSPTRWFDDHRHVFVDEVGGFSCYGKGGKLWKTSNVREAAWLARGKD